MSKISPLPRRLLLLLAAVTLSLLTVLAGTASAHSLDSTTIAVITTTDSVEATISLALPTVDEALGTDYATDDPTTYDENLIAYIDEHLTATSADGTVWTEVYETPERKSVEGIESVYVRVLFETGDSTISRFTLSYDAIIDALPDHQAVVVLTDSNVDISTAGVIDADHPQLVITDAAHRVPVLDMIGYGFNHVLEGADHLLFLATLLLPAPLVIVAGRWQRGSGPIPALRKVVHVVTSFTIGHSITLIASALGWVSIPSRPVEVLIAVSVGVSAVNAIRPLTDHGEEIIAGAFGLVHGLAFAGILAALGLAGSTSVLTLLAFNVGIELAQLLVTVMVFPSLYLLSLTRFYSGFRIAGASIALLAALSWALDRLGVIPGPLVGIEEAMIDHPWRVVIGLATLAVVARLVSGPTDNTDAEGQPEPGAGTRAEAEDQAGTEAEAEAEAENHDLAITKP